MPTFSIRRNLINIPELNQTADAIYNRMMPNPGGDCKLVSDDAPYSYAQYNLTVTGAPVAIACNQTSASSVDGTSSLMSNVSVSAAARFGNQTASSPGNNTYSGNGTARPGVLGDQPTSTDGLNHHAMAPQQPLGFDPHYLNASNAICLGGTSGESLCLPSGTYEAPSGSVGSVSSSTLATLTMPAGSSLSFVSLQQHSKWALWDGDTYSASNYTSNQAGGDSDFTASMPDLSHTSQSPQSPGADTFSAILSPNTPDPLVVCLFTKANYLGDVSCYGPGSGNLTIPGAANSANSLLPHGGATAWIYAQSYNDNTAVQISNPVPDLSKVPLGNDGNFANAIKALWVIDPHTM